MEGYDASTYGDRWADVYDDWYDDPEETAATVAFLAAVAGPPAEAGVLVELGVGTGRLALPLQDEGYDVRGIDASAAMVDRLRAKAGGDRLPVAIGDMTAVAVPSRPGEPAAPGPTTTAGVPGRPEVGGVFVASNTFFGLASLEAQRACLRAAAAVLRPGGWFALAAFVPADDVTEGRPGSVGVRSLTADRVVLTADVVDASAQTISGQYIDISADGVRLRPFHIRWLLPHQLDHLAAEAGLRLVDRWSSWDGAPFDDDSGAHVSLYRR